MPQTTWSPLPETGAALRGCAVRPSGLPATAGELESKAVAYQSLYLLYRPRKFAEIKGQDHVIRALQTAVREQKVGHAYLLHGPRGSGKTSTARVLAKALNCTDIGSDGEPCCVCESCVSIQQGRSFDLQELDAASNNKVDDMRTLLERVSLASPGRAKVYLLDEVHMLTPGAENALLKTLEEPPSHVTWVLATTEPHRVAQTIRSRCQVFELGLVGADLMADHVRYVSDDAGLAVTEEAVDYVVAAGAGSVRDTLSALDRVAAGGGVVELDSSTDEILEAIARHDHGRALAAIGDATGRGRDPRTVGETVLAGLRDAFLTAMGDPPPRLSEHERARASTIAEEMAPPAMTRALETLGRALIDMRQAPDPRVDLEVALVRLCQPDEERLLESLLQRVQRLEERLGAPHGAPPGAPHTPRPAAPASEAPVSADPAVITTGSTPRGTAAPARPGPQPRGRPGEGGPAQSARERLGPRPSRAAPRSGPPSASPPQPGSQRAAPPPVPGGDPTVLRPQTARELVEFAGRHLGLSRDEVIARANELLPARQGGRRGPDELVILWRDLVSRWEAQQPGRDQPSPEPPSAPEPAGQQDSSTEPEPGPVGVPSSGLEPGAVGVPSSGLEPGPVGVPSSGLEPGAVGVPSSGLEPGAVGVPSSGLEPGAVGCLRRVGAWPGWGAFIGVGAWRGCGARREARARRARCARRGARVPWARCARRGTGLRGL